MVLDISLLRYLILLGIRLNSRKGIHLAVNTIDHRRCHSQHAKYSVLASRFTALEEVLGFTLSVRPIYTSGVVAFPAFLQWLCMPTCVAIIAPFPPC